MSIHALVLAAGAGTRMGQPKALTQLGGRSLSQRAVENIRRAGIADCTVILGAKSEEAAAHLDPSQATCVINPQWELGQTSSLQCGLSALAPAADAFLIYPVDFGLVMETDLAALKAAWITKAARQRSILRPVCGAIFGHPVLFSRDFAEDFLSLDPGEPANHIYKQNREAVQLIEVSNPGIGQDLDTSDELAAAEKWLAER